ncbi:hypothetical protein B0I37DRAFT_424890 [Chaetomium sp. MPI-CAGE-AT-0009]|nr:hypothetical protein B0I37DRAFT_424890 [Chaetomium sp. MPI-CAGE-AT-0009]
MNDRSADIKVPTLGTCQWLFHHKEWKRWLSDRGDLMWIKGKPGSGKSTLLRYAESELKKTRVKRGDLTLSFFFHGRGEELQRSPLGMYRSLLCQLLKQEPESLSQLVETFKSKWDGKQGSKVTWDVEHLGNFLDWAMDEISTHRTIWLFVDALDECGREGAEEVLQRFNRLRRPGLFICVSCRHYPLQNWGGGFEIKVEEQNNLDIFKYAQSQLAHLQDRTTLPIPNLIATHSNGLFIWARLAVERLRKVEIGIGREDIENVVKETVDSIPQDLDDLYRNIVNDIEKTPAALALIRWVLCAQRPLTLDELPWAVIVDPNSHPDSHYASLEQYKSVAPAYTKSKDAMEIGVKILSHGLLETVRSASGRRVIQFIHQTVMDFFNNGGLLLLNGDEGSAETSLDHAHDHIFRTCIAYSNMPGVDPNQGLGGGSNFPLLGYATQFWIAHAGLSQKSQTELLDRLGWPSNHFVDLWVQHYRALHTYFENADCPPYGIGIAHVVARNELPTSLSKMLERKDELDINAPDGLKRTPLVYAAGACVNTRDYMGATPLHWAALRGHTELISLLLEHGASSETKTSGGCTPLAWAGVYPPTPGRREPLYP